MKTTARKMSIFVVMAVATTTLMLGTSTVLAASNTHTHHVIQVKSSGDDWFPSTVLAASNTHTHHHNMHLLSSNANHLTGTNGINGIGSRNDDFSTGWPGSFSPTQYGSTVNNSHHHHSPTGTIADINSANKGFGGNDDFSNSWANSN